MKEDLATLVSRLGGAGCPDADTGFERETECWCCEVTGQALSLDLTQRSFRTATSGAASASKGDVRLLHTPWLPPILFECKHLTDNTKHGPAFHMYDEWIQKVAEEATAAGSVPCLTWAFKHARTNRGEGRVQFLFPSSLISQWVEATKLPLVRKSDLVKHVERKSKYFLVYHDQLWKDSQDSTVLTGFDIRVPLQTTFGADWTILARRHLQLLWKALREKNMKGEYPLGRLSSS